MKADRSCAGEIFEAGNELLVLHGMETVSVRLQCLGVQKASTATSG
ncbi:hypothetical protein [Streptomyces sp. 35G-GA-8]|nr:hypothetical protein [Streptomyces sp. 35G-GA-8]MCL7379636.1 hypothetical protein [Streptomyces sp. 35G-GA-8]